MIRAILFDFDGVIVQTEPLHKRTFIELLEPFGVEISDERWYQEFAGTGSRKIFRALLDEHGANTDITELVNKRRDMFIDYVKQGKTEPTEGLLSFLEHIRAKNLRSAIVSGGHRSYIELLIKMLKIEKFFEYIVAAEDIPERKPDPTPFLLAAKEVGIKPKECLVIEDSYSGCKAGKAAGMKVAWMRPHKSMAPPECDLIIENFRSSELLTFLDSSP